MADTRSRVSFCVGGDERCGLYRILRSSDADEMWTQTISSLHQALRPAGSSKSFVDQYLSADLQQT